MSITPLFGHGFDRRARSSRCTADMFVQRAESERFAENALRSKALVEFLNGARSTLDTLSTEFGDELGSDAFDQRIMADRS